MDIEIVSTKSELRGRTFSPVPTRDQTCDLPITSPVFHPLNCLPAPSYHATIIIIAQTVDWVRYQINSLSAAQGDLVQYKGKIYVFASSIARYCCYFFPPVTFGKRIFNFCLMRKTTIPWNKENKTETALSSRQKFPPQDKQSCMFWYKPWKQNQPLMHNHMNTHSNQERCITPAPNIKEKTTTTASAWVGNVNNDNVHAPMMDFSPHPQESKLATNEKSSRRSNHTKTSWPL